MTAADIPARDLLQQAWRGEVAPFRCAVAVPDDRDQNCRQAAANSGFNLVLAGATIVAAATIVPGKQGNRKDIVCN